MAETCCCERYAVHPKQAGLKVLNNRHRIGMHIKLKQDFLSSFSGGPSRKVNQLYLTARCGKVIRDITFEEKEKLGKKLDRNNETFYIHCPLNLNLARLDGDPFLYDSQNVILGETEIVQGLAGACVLHIGNGLRGGTIHTVAQHLNNLSLPRNTHPRMDSLLYLENSAGAGNNLGSTWDELRKLFEAVDKPGPGLCVDTQHLFAAGMSRLDGHESVVELFDEIESIIPKMKPIFHLNDSKVEFGRKTDFHASIGKGKIWSLNDEGLHSLIDRCTEGSIDTILETKTPAADLEMIQQRYYIGESFIPFE